jgi:peptidoglycan-N-acetylglucosamine deacetylase
VTGGAGEGAVLLLHDGDDYSAAGSWRRTAAALPRVLETLAARRLAPMAP